MPVRIYILFILISSLLFSCTDKSAQPEGLTVVSFNVQSIFDDIDDGDEFSPYRKYEGWNSGKYTSRLERLRSYIKEGLGADIIFFQEVESAKVLEDLLDSSLRRRGYLYYDIADTSTPISVGFISKYNPLSVTVHSAGDQRLLLRAEFLIEGRQYIFYCLHAKSRRGDEDTGKENRKALARLVNSLAKMDSDAMVIVLGDFNCEPDQDAEDLLCLTTRYDSATVVGKGSIALAMEMDEVDAYSFYDPLLDPTVGINANGTYFYNGSFYDYDRIILNHNAVRLCPDLRFSIVTDINQNGAYPYAYDPKTGLGLSDHFPVKLTLF